MFYSENSKVKWLYLSCPVFNGCFVFNFDFLLSFLDEGGLRGLDELQIISSY